MQPTPPSAPNQPAPRSRPSSGSGILVGLIILLAVVYLLDHARGGDAAVFSGVNRRISATDFRGAQCVAVFGECKIDLRDAKIQGSEAILEAYSVFGNVEVWVPEDWEVVNHGFAIFGGLGDQRRHSSADGETKTLVVQGAAVFGGVQIRN